MIHHKQIIFPNILIFKPICVIFHVSTFYKTRLQTTIERSVTIRVATGGTDGNTTWWNSWTSPPVITAEGAPVVKCNLDPVLNNHNALNQCSHWSWEIKLLTKNYLFIIIKISHLLLLKLCPQSYTKPKSWEPSRHGTALSWREITETKPVAPVSI